MIEKFLEAVRADTPESKSSAIYILQQKLQELVDASKPFLNDMSEEQLERARKRLARIL